MNNYEITCCSTADMPLSFFEEKKIPYACFHFTMDGMEYADDLGKSISIDEFYRRVKNGSLPVTSQVNAEAYEQMFEPILKNGRDVVHLTLSSGISGTYNSAIIARDELRERYPDRRIEVIDSLAASSGYGLLVEAAWEKRQEGYTLDQLCRWLEQHKLQVQHWFFTSDLSHLKRGGRISGSAAFVGGMLNICPLMDINDEGKLIPRDKIRGKKKVIREIVNRMKERAADGEQYSGKCFISQSACMEDAKEVAALVEETFPRLDGPVRITDIGTVIGSHTGPGTVAMFYWGSSRKEQQG